MIEHRAADSIGGKLCGGTVDRIGMMNGKLWTINLKAPTGCMRALPLSMRRVS